LPVSLSPYFRYHLVVSEVAIFANPISGSGQGKLIAQRVGLALRRAGYEVHLCLDRPSAESVGQVCAGRDLRCLIVIGGDGTVRAVVSHMLEHRARDPLVPILIIPMGTAN